jgi:putative OPT family oligopeptide transporter
MHGKYPFPEATATTEILVSGAKGGNQAKLLLTAGLIGGVYDFLMTHFKCWAEDITSRFTEWGTDLATNYKFVFKMNAGSVLLGTGFLIGLKYTTIICAGSFLSWWFIVPLLGQYGAMPDGTLMSTLEPELIFSDFVRYIGIGGIAMAGIIGVIKSAGVIKSSFGVVFASRKKSGDAQAKVERTQKDIAMRIILFGFLAVAIMIVIFFLTGGLSMSLSQTLIGLLVIFIFAFLFTTVAATAIATVGTNPVSGMTMMTLILSSFILSAVGLKGGTGIITALIVGGIVCSALAMAGGFITDLKIGYWIGSTPMKQQALKFVGTLVSAITVGFVIMLLSKTYGYTGDNALVAPQANAMAAIIKPLMFSGQTPWVLYIIGAILAIVLDRIGIPALAFSLGMFIPLQLNIPLLVGGFIAWLVSTRSKDELINKARKEKATLIASGLLAGGAIFGVISAILKYAAKFTLPDRPIYHIIGKIFKHAGAEGVIPNSYFNSPLFNTLSVVMFVGLCTYLIWHSRTERPNDENIRGFGYYRKCIQHYAVFSGRARRKEFWLFILFNVIFSFAAMFLDNILKFAVVGNYGLIYILYALAVFIPGLAVGIRRLHDIGKSGWFFLIGLIPIIGGIWLFVLFCIKGQPGENQYGRNPK